MLFLRCFFFKCVPWTTWKNNKCLPQIEKHIWLHFHVLRFCMSACTHFLESLKSKQEFLRHAWIRAGLFNFKNKQDRFKTFFKYCARTGYEMGPVYGKYPCLKYLPMFFVLGIYVTSFSSISYFRHVRLISKIFTLASSTFFGNKHGLGIDIGMQFNAKQLTSMKS